jgi:hypothetical protein
VAGSGIYKESCINKSTVTAVVDRLLLLLRYFLALAALCSLMRILFLYRNKRFICDTPAVAAAAAAATATSSQHSYAQSYETQQHCSTINEWPVAALQ